VSLDPPLEAARVRKETAMAPTFQQDVHQARKNRIYENLRRVQRVLRELAWDLEDTMNEVFQRHGEASVEDKPALQMEHDRLEAARFRLDRRSEASIRKRDERLQALVPEERRASRKSTRPTQRSQRPSS
jgi:ElaB/YqjD/DUF883 family membrane-anchored ribosome-binding protein